MNKTLRDMEGKKGKSVILVEILKECVGYKLALAIYLFKNQIMCCCTCWFSTLPKRSSGWRAEMRYSVLCPQWKTGKTGLQIVRYFQKLILWAQFLYLLISRKALKSFMVTTVSRDWQKASAKIGAWLHVFTLYQNHTSTDLSPMTFREVSQSYLGCCLQGCSLHFAPNKT